MTIDNAKLEALVIFATIAQGLRDGKQDDEVLGETSKDVTFVYKMNDVEYKENNTICTKVTDKDVEHFHKTFITYEGHYA